MINYTQINHCCISHFVYSDIHSGASIANIDIKTLQYVMEYFDVSATLNIYTHVSYKCAVEQITKILDFKDTDKQKNREN